MSKFASLKPIYRSSLTRKAALKILQFSAIVAFVISFAEGTVFYYGEQSRLLAQVQNLAESRAKSLATSSWNVDVEQTTILLDEMAKLDYVKYVSLRTDSNNVFVSGVADKRVEDAYAYKKTLIYSSNGHKQVVGVLYIAATSAPLLSFYNISTLLAEALKVLLIAFIVMLILYHQIIKHLLHISRYLTRASFSEVGAALVLDKVQQSPPDELDSVAKELNELLQALSVQNSALQNQHSELEALVEERTHGLIEAKREADEASMAKSQFLSSMSHELRTPMNAIIGFTQLLDTSNTLDEKQRGFIANIDKAGEHLLGLINEILDLAKIESGNAEFKLESIDVNESLIPAIEIVRPLADQKKVAINLDQQSLQLVSADVNRLKQVFINLLTNAIKYNHVGGHIRVYTEVLEASREVKIVFEDTGFGLSEEQLADLFKPFNRLGQECGDIEGTGIGLTICQTLLEKMNGRIEVDSQVGRGSQFKVYLPFSHPESRRSTGQASDKALESISLKH